uniref:Uncharacterized protein n=1 Tax=Ornithorhynchus anatinus TaxID=9258 RepID=A0A6I8N5D6_ORNAN
MAASLDRLSPSEAFSAPDENEFPFGYPAHICQDSPPSKYLCCSCQNVLRRAQQTLCGHRYCAACLSWIVRSSKNPMCQKCKEEDPQVVSEESLLTEEKAFSDAAINKEISELNVHCVTPGCSWTGLMKNFEDHQAECDCALIPCHAGCGLMIMRKKLPDHLENGCAKSPTTCLKCKQTFCSMEYQKHVCQSSSCKDPMETSTETGPEDKVGEAGMEPPISCPFLSGWVFPWELHHHVETSPLLILHVFVWSLVWGRASIRLLATVGYWGGNCISGGLASLTAWSSHSEEVPHRLRPSSPASHSLLYLTGHRESGADHQGPLPLGCLGFERCHGHPSL